MSILQQLGESSKSGVLQTWRQLVAFTACALALSCAYEQVSDSDTVSATRSAVLGDRPNDGILDRALGSDRPRVGGGSGLLWLEPDGTLRIWDMASASDFKAFSLGTAPAGSQPIASGDFDADGHGDILLRNPTAQSLSLWRLADTLVVEKTAPTNNAPFHALSEPRPFTGDFDADGVSDLAWIGRVTSSTIDQPLFGSPSLSGSGNSLQWLNRTEKWLMNPGTTLPRSTSIVDDLNTALLGVGNFDGLGGADFIQRDTFGTVSVVLSGGQIIPIQRVSKAVNLAGVGDFNGDGVSDAVWYDTASGGVTLWHMRDGAVAEFIGCGMVRPSSGWSILGVADVNHDKVSELVWRHTNGTVAFGCAPMAGIALDPRIAFAGVVELGAPPQLIEPVVSRVYINDGVPYASVDFQIPSLARHDDLVMVEDAGVTRDPSTQIVQARALPSTQGNLSIDPFSFQAHPAYEIQVNLWDISGRSDGCFRVRSYEQGRLSAPSKVLCAGGLPPPTAAFEWQMPDTFGADADGDGAIDLVPAVDVLASARNDKWSIDLDGSASNDPAPGDGWVSEYTWYVLADDNSLFQVQQGPAVRFSDLPEGGYHTFLFVSTPDGRNSYTYRHIDVQNHLIVSLGDSYASGEGNPLAWQYMREWVSPGPRGPQTVRSRVPPFWGTPADQRCHRSANAAAARAALGIERGDPHSSVTFISFACSGAGLGHLIDTVYDGVEAPPGSTANRPQIAQLKTLLCKNTTLADFCGKDQLPNIDALLLTVGGNDIGFGNIIKTCTASPTACSGDDEFTRATFESIDHLADEMSTDRTRPTYAQLHRKLGELNIGQVFINEYPDPTTEFDPAHPHDPAFARVCEKFVLEGVITDMSPGGQVGTPGGAILGGLLGGIIGSAVGGPVGGTILTTAGTIGGGAKSDGIIGHEDLIWAQEIVVRLDAKVAWTGSKFGWIPVTGIKQDFRGYGYCADPHYIIRYEESSDQIGLGLLGTLHPNQSGQVAIAKRLLTTMVDHGIGAPNSLAAMPTDNVLPAP